MRRRAAVNMNNLMIAIVLISPCLGDVSHLLSEYSTTSTTPPPPPRPYSFQYQAGRFPGNVDRVHQESGDGAGHVRGSYSFVDPKHKLRTVEYAADENGFHASLINYEDAISQPVDSEAVRLAKERHFRLYQKIAEANAHGIPVNLPRDSASVGRAKDRHNQLYQKIAQEHAAIAAQRETERLAYEATSVVNDVSPLSFRLLFGDRVNEHLSLPRNELVFPTRRVHLFSKLAFFRPATIVTAFIGSTLQLRRVVQGINAFAVQCDAIGKENWLKVTIGYYHSLRTG